MRTYNTRLFHLFCVDMCAFVVNMFFHYKPKKNILKNVAGGILFSIGIGMPCHDSLLLN